VEGWAAYLFEVYTIEIDHFEDSRYKDAVCAQTSAQDESFTNDTPTKIGCPNGWRREGGV